MSTINGLPAHVLLVHVIVVFVPLTSVLLILSALWPAVRRRLIWLVSALAAITVALTPVTTDAGESLKARIGRPSPAIQTHAELGEKMIYFVIPLLLIAALLAVVHLRERRDKPLARALTVLIAVLAIVGGVAATTQAYRVGDSGARAVWRAQVDTASFSNL
jgi:hypothetical protein